MGYRESALDSGYMEQDDPGPPSLADRAVAARWELRYEQERQAKAEVAWRQAEDHNMLALLLQRTLGLTDLAGAHGTACKHLGMVYIHRLGEQMQASARPAQPARLSAREELFGVGSHR